MAVEWCRYESTVGWIPGTRCWTTIDFFAWSCLHLLCKALCVTGAQDALVIDFILGKHFLDDVERDPFVGDKLAPIPIGGWVALGKSACESVPVNISYVIATMRGKKSSFIFLRRAVVVILSLLASFMDLKIIVVLARTPSASSAAEWPSSGSLIPAILCGLGSVSSEHGSFSCSLCLRVTFMSSWYVRHWLHPSGLASF